MADFYFDSVAGNDSTGNGSEANPWATYEGRFSSTAFADRLFFRRGTTQVITTQFRMPRSYMGAYGTGPRPRFVYAGTPWANILNGAGLSGVTLESLDFDMGGNTWSSIYIACQGSTNVSGWTVRDCIFHGSSQRSGVSVVREASATSSITGVVFEDCEFFDNSEHGTIVIGASGVTYRRCKAWGNGATNINGGHGFSARWLRDDVTSGWTLVSGNIYKRALSAAQQVQGVKYVQTPLANRNRLAENVSTPATPGLDEFGNSGGELFINIGQNPAGVSIRFAWGRASDLLWEDCQAWGNIDNPAAEFIEGHGFAFDDFVETSRMRRCHSFGNQGCGYSINRGDGNALVHCTAQANGGPAVQVFSSNGVQIDNCTLIDNLRGSPRTPTPSADSEVFFSPQATGAIRNSLIHVTRPGVSWVVRDDVFTTVTAANSRLTGAASAMRTGTPSNTVAGSGDFTPEGRPISGSPLLTGGADLGYLRDIEGKQSRRHIGAYGAARLT